MLSITSVDPFKNNKLVKIVENIKQKKKKNTHEEKEWNEEPERKWQWMWFNVIVARYCADVLIHFVEIKAQYVWLNFSTNYVVKCKFCFVFYAKVHSLSDSVASYIDHMQIHMENVPL